MTPGAHVQHPIYGGGRVLGLLAGARVHVAFDEHPRMPRIVEQASLSNGEPAAVHAQASAGRRAAPRTADADAWQSIEALRLGVVPLARAEAYTVGREVELESLQRLLDDRHGLRLLFGDYGHGKTHLLDVFEHVAHTEGFVTARATLDPAEMPPSHPLRLYRGLMTNLRCPEAADCSPLPLFDRLAGSPAHQDPDGARYSRFLSPALAAHSRKEDNDVAARLLDYVQGHEVDVDELNHDLGSGHPRLLKLADYRTYGRMYAHLLGTWATWCGDAGYKGLVVIFDEVERVSALDAEHLRLAEQVLRHYAAVTLAPAHLAFDPESAAELYQGGQPVHRALPLRFAADQPLSVAMALTPAPEVTALVDRILSSKSVRIDIPALPKRYRSRLVDRVVAQYRKAYPAFEADTVAVQRIREQVLAVHADEDASPRPIVRTAVFLLDALRHRGPAAP